VGTAPACDVIINCQFDQMASIVTVSRPSVTYAQILRDEIVEQRKSNPAREVLGGGMEHAVMVDDHISALALEYHWLLEELTPTAATTPTAHV
jgi:hypothetical protein